ncbi:S-adenosyl methyltransferase [Streptomyces sp. Amel2xB2]|uniref:SAM-dependent methyltransferase n=1 Tax=Streptomyces sp. Amel2xB2 TaxID=1305829 RepID=UPI000DB9B33D|nr:SAM-dependent methyltransferase [Streptomyces sp. Amel2xB2]RAJ69000.1 S-adenosyl methyltransferase [Streptomyces sp. Amel2xB2]
MERPAWAPQGIDLTVPSVSRMYDYYLGGSHNFEVDREAGRRAIEAWPGLPKIIQANRAFMRRAIRFAVGEGITQFLDIGSGIPTFGNVHEAAQSADPSARVVYVDNDPVAVAHSRSVLEGNDRAEVVSADFRSPQDILYSAEVERLLDLERPVALLLVALLHFIEDKDDPWKTVREIADELAPGSLLVLSHSSADEGPMRSVGGGVRDVYRQTSSPLITRSRTEITQFFDGFELVEPGVVPLPRWRPEDVPGTDDPLLLSGYAGVGRKAGRVG